MVSTHTQPDAIHPRTDLLLNRAFVVVGIGLLVKVYAGAPHGLASTHQVQFNEDLLAFING